MNRKSPAKPVRLARLRRHWKWWLTGSLLLVSGLAAIQIWRVTAPPPPLVNTKNFDPVIAAAIAEARQAVVHWPRSAKARGHMGMVLLAHDVRPEARVCFAQACAFAPRDPRWPYFLGMAELVDNPLAAATNLEQAVRLFPEQELAPRLRLADTLLSLGRLEEAEALYRRIWQIDTNCAPAALGLGKIASARDRATEAAEFLGKATTDPCTRKAAHRVLLSVDQRLGRTNEAEQLTRALAELPNDKPFPDPLSDQIEQLKTGEKVWIDRGDDLIKAGRVAEAETLLEKAVQTYPYSDRALFFLGRAKLRRGDSAGAEAMLARAVALAPDSVEAQMQLGVVRLTRGRPQQAQPCFRAAIRAKPNLPEAWYNLGLTLGKDVNRAECIAAFREAIRLKPNLFEAYLGLSVVLQADGQDQAAIGELCRALDLQPEEPLRQKLSSELTQIRQGKKPGH